MRTQAEISKDIEYLNSSNNQLTVLDNIEHYTHQLQITLFSKARRLFTRMNTVLGHK